MPRKARPDTPPRKPGFVSVRLDLTEEERDALRVIAAGSPQKTMAIFVRELVRQEIARRKADSR